MNPLLKLFNSLVTRGFEQFGRYYSSYRGFVLDNNDPDKFGRLKIRVPAVFGTQVLEYWAWQKDCFSGPGYGMQCIPSIGDMVWVEFELGDARKPIWTYGHFSLGNGNTPDKPEVLSKVGNYWFKTPGGMLVELNDADSIIRVTHSNGKIITIKDTINLGSEDAAEQMILGNTLLTQLESICDNINNITEAIGQLTVTTPMGPSGVPTNAAEFANLGNSILDIKDNLEVILSEVSKTD